MKFFISWVVLFGIVLFLTYLGVDMGTVLFWAIIVIAIGVSAVTMVMSVYAAITLCGMGKRGELFNRLCACGNILRDKDVTCFLCKKNVRLDGGQ